jgi:putative PIG3 family NAD(P)H quinone oxidoreductase
VLTHKPKIILYILSFQNIEVGMLAIQVIGDEERTLAWQRVPDPTCGSEEVLVDVCATALNRADLFQRAGKYPPPSAASDILGLEIAGKVSVLGDKVGDWELGDRVCALLPGCGYAERVAVPTEMLMPIPKDWSYEQAASLPECFLTVFTNVYMEAGLQSGETILVHGGASGVGTAAIQLASITGNPIFVTAGSSEKVNACKQLGADLAINYRKHDFGDKVLSYTNGKGVDVIMDIVAGSYMERNIQLLKSKGRLVVISTLGGVRTEIDLSVLMRRRARIIGSVLRSRSVSEKIEIKQRFMDYFWPHVLEGRIMPVIDSIYPISQAMLAHQHMKENRNIGKIVLKIQ